MTSAAWRATVERRPAAIICLSRTGFTVRSMARFRPDVPILAFSGDERTVRQLTMSWGTTPMHLPDNAGVESMMRQALAESTDRGLVHSGDLVAVLSGTDSVPLRAADTLRLVHVP
jgi:pyruvate kinase